jgi:superfamily II DNA or RNA helicase
MPTIYDNIENYLTEGLEKFLKDAKRTDLCVGYFNLRGWNAIENTIDTLTGEEIPEGEEQKFRVCRLLIGMHNNPHEIIREQYSIEENKEIDNKKAAALKKRLALEFKEQLTIGTPTDKDETVLRKLCQQLKNGRVAVKLYLRNKLHAKLYISYPNNNLTPKAALLGSSNLTFSGLSHQGELNIDVLEQDAASKLVNWFEERWNDSKSYDITKDLIEVIETSWATEKPILPYYIYLKIAYHLSQEARAGINEYKLPRVFDNKLLDFQQKAVLVATHHLQKRGGVIIGDVVGLGKTITATAVAKIMEEDFYLETLIICPKNLTQMWEDYAHKYQLRAKVISQSVVQNDLPELRRYRLVIIDESHNLRNSEGARYRAIKEYIFKNESKVIMLTATPYNKSFIDLSNQLRLFIADDADLGISPDEYIKLIGGQVKFNAQHNDTFIRSIKAFEKSNIADDWRELMRLYLVRRTRSFIKSNYAIVDPQNNKPYLLFNNNSRQYLPERIPSKLEFGFNNADNCDLYAKFYSQDVVETINNLFLPRYGLGNYVKKNIIRPLTNDEKRILENLSRAGRRLMGFCRTNIFKRLESSGYAFLLTLKRHLLRNYVYIYACQNGLDIPIGKNEMLNFDDYIDDEDIEEADENIINGKENNYLNNAKGVYEDIYVANKTRFDWLSFDIFEKNIIRELKHDCNLIQGILDIGKDWKAENDRKLMALYRLVVNKHANEKILVFTQYADTAKYIFNYLKLKNVEKIEVVTGDSESPTQLAYRFSPVSNEKTNIKKENELRVLIATDVLSEGQNLQDSHIVVNYDLPWAIIRLIQRAGRVDRIGQQSDKILCYSFLPEAGIENIINLRNRLRTRINQNADVLGSDEQFFEGDPINIADLYNEKSGILDEPDDDSEVDLSSQAYQIWLNAIKLHPHLQKTVIDLSNVSYSTKQEQSVKDDNAIVYVRTAEDNDVLALVNNKGEIITKSQTAILKAAACNYNTKAEEKISNHHEIVKNALKQIFADEKNSGVSLGKKTSVKYKVFSILERFCNENNGTFLVTDELKKAVDEILKYPLKENAKDTLNRQLKANIDEYDLAELVVDLSKQDKLCVITEEENFNREPQIICSMGIKKG